MKGPPILLWNAPRLGGLAPEQWTEVIDHLLVERARFLRIDLRRSEYAGIDAGKSCGFSVDFWSTQATLSPLDLNVYGTFGGSVYDDPYMAVQGWLYPYLQGQGLATTADGHNHIFLRYAIMAADDYDWDMEGCTRKSAWRSLGWNPDLYGEFDGHDDLHDGPGA